MMKQLPLSSHIFILDSLTVSGKVCKLQGRGSVESGHMMTTYNSTHMLLTAHLHS